MAKPSSDMSYVYTLIDPRDQAVVYVGVSMNPKRRFSQIKSKTVWTSCGKAVIKWIEELRQLNIAPSLEVVEECSNHNRGHRELFWIEHFLDLGYDLLNYDGVERTYGISTRWT